MASTATAAEYGNFCVLKTRVENTWGNNPNTITVLNSIYFSGYVDDTQSCLARCAENRARAADGEIISCLYYEKGTYSVVPPIISRLDLPAVEPRIEEIAVYSGPKDPDPIELRDTNRTNAIQNHWTCYLTYEPKPREPGAQPDPNSADTRCIDMRANNGGRNSQIQSEQDAQSICYNICSTQVSSAGRVASCRFFRSVGCENDKKLAVITDKLLLEADTEDLKKELSTLRSLSRFSSIQDAIGSLVVSVVSVLGSIAFAFYVYAGLLWMTARGNSDKTEQAMKIIVWTTLGVCMVLGSYVLADFVLQGFQ